MKRAMIAYSVFCAFAATALAACASTGATYKSGVGDTYLEHPPYAAGATLSRLNIRASSVGYLPIVFDDGASQASIFDPRYGEGTAIGALVAEMNLWLDSATAGVGLGVRLADGGRVSAVAHAETRTPPNVMFGCITESNVPDNECVARGDSALGRRNQRMRLAVGRPSTEWIGWVSDLMRDRQLQYTLVITLEVGQYWPRQRGLLGRKEVELGTGNTVSLPWLTSLETPVAVLQFTGALVGADGRALRIAAEGFAEHRTALPISALGGQSLLSDSDVEHARTRRRMDLADSPLAWEAALTALLNELVPGFSTAKRAM